MEKDWKLFTEQKPEAFDLLAIETEDKRKKIGWWDGRDWWGRGVKEDEKVTRWKRYNPILN